MSKAVVFLLVAFGFVATMPDRALAQPYGWSAQSLFVQRLPPFVDSLVVLDMGTGERVASFPAPAGVRVRPGALTPDGVFYLLPTDVGLARLRTSPPAFDRIIGPATAINTIAVAPTGTSVYVTGAFGRGILDWESGAVSNVQCCAQPFISFSPDGAIRVEAQPGPGTPPQQSTITAYDQATGTLRWSIVVPSNTVGAVVGDTAAALAVTLDSTPSTLVLNLADGTERSRLANVSGAMAWTSDALVVSSGTWLTPHAPSTARLSRFDATTLAETVLLESPAVILRLSPLSVKVSSDGRYAYWLWYQSFLGVTVSSTSYLVVDLATGSVAARGSIGSQGQADLTLESAPHCLFTLPGNVAAPAAGGTVSIPVQAGSACRPWRTSSPAILNQGPHQGDVVLSAHLWPNTSALPSETQLNLLGQSVRITQPAAPPAAPVLTAAVEGARVRLSWQLSAGAGITSFELRGAIGGNPLAPVATVSASLREWVSPLLAAGAYTVMLVPRNGAGFGEPSNVVTFSTGVSGTPEAPTGLNALVVDDQVTLSWQPLVVGAAPEGFIVEGAAAGSSTFVEVARTSAPSAYLTRVPVGTWQVRVRARTAGATGAPTAAIPIAPAACTTPPTRPLQPWAIQTFGMITIGGSGLPTMYSVQWAAPASGSVDEYIVEAGAVPGASDVGVFVVRGDQRAVTQALTNLRAFVRIRARNACGVSAASDEVAVLAQ